MWIVYALRCPVVDAIRYIGITRQHISERLRKHVTDSRCGRSSKKCDWIRALLAVNKLPSVEILEVTPDWDQRERYWIALLRPTGLLTNETSGGQFTVLDSDARRRISQSKIGKRRKPETVERMAEALSGRKLSAEHRAAISSGTRNSAKVLANIAVIAARNKGRPITENHRQRMKEGWRRKVATGWTKKHG